jgi:hypothetical protein
VQYVDHYTTYSKMHSHYNIKFEFQSVANITIYTVGPEIRIAVSINSGIACNVEFIITHKAK